MCELFGFTARRPMDIRDRLREFYTHSTEHPHGWGLMYSGGVLREGVRALDSRLLPRVLEGMSPQTVTLGHIRFATVGSVRTENCHPFQGWDVTGRLWTMIHNGTIYSGSRIIHTHSRQKGDTDSERLFLYLLERMDEAQRGRPLTGDERFGLIDEIVREMSPRNKLNLIIWDGEQLYVHKNMENTLGFLKLDGGYIFSTRPVGDGAWEELPLAVLTAYRDGEHVRTGKAHGGIFVPTLSQIKAMDAMNI